jgi:hypothetical protein
MSGSPTTFRAEPSDGEFDWNETGALHRSDDGGGVLHGLKAVRHGTLAELVRHVASLPDEERRHYTILKSGDHRLSPGEIMALSRRPDFPAA